MILEEMGANSAAAKAGLKPHDILLELAGKPVSSNPAKFVHLLREIPSGTPVDAVVIRKGKREAVKDLALPGANVDATAELLINPR
jgi:S1-C subfamily serine protease